LASARLVNFQHDDEPGGLHADEAANGVPPDDPQDAHDY